MRVGLGQLQISQGCVMYEDPNTGLYSPDAGTSALCDGGDLMNLWASQAVNTLEQAVVPQSGSATGNANVTQSASGLCAALGIGCPTNIPSPFSPSTSLLLMALLFGAAFLVIETAKR